jgi:recombination protein RecA
VGTKKRKRLEAAVTAIQRKWGFKALHKATPTPRISSISTSFASLDKILDGGIPRRQISEIRGQPTSGMATLALKILSQAQQSGDVAIYLDLNHTFDADELLPVSWTSG